MPRARSPIAAADAARALSWPDLYLLRKKCFISMRALSSQINHLSQLLFPMHSAWICCRLLTYSKLLDRVEQQRGFMKCVPPVPVPAFFALRGSHLGPFPARDASSNNYDTFAMFLQIACLRHRWTTPFSASLERKQNSVQIDEVWYHIRNTNTLCIKLLHGDVYVIWIRFKKYYFWLIPLIFFKGMFAFWYF